MLMKLFNQVFVTYNNLISVMIRRRSTLDHAQRIKHNKFVEIFSILDLCLQLPSDDRILIRNKIKSGDEELQGKVYQCKKDKNYHNLQIYLRKYVQKAKQNEKFNLGRGKTNNRGRTPQTLKSMKNQTQSSYHNSLQNSLTSSPSAKKHSKGSVSKLQLAKHIESEINKQIKRQIEKQECEQQVKDITPREIRVQIKPMGQLRNCQNTATKCQLDMKEMIKAKMNEREKNPSHKTEQRFSHKFEKQNNLKQILQSVGSTQLRPALTLSINGRNNTLNYKWQQQHEEKQKYGQFYKRIKQVIEQAH